MKVLSNRRNFFAIMVMALLLLAAVPTSFGQGHGKGRGRDTWNNRGWSKHDRKCAKFVNCHDASDGRRDGRGPRGDRVGNGVWRNRLRQRNRVIDPRQLWQRRTMRHNR